MAAPERHGSPVYELETTQGVRRLEFDDDVFRRRDVRVLVDGKSVASLPFPKPASPYQEVAFQLDGHDLIAVAWLPTESWAEGLPLRYDIVANGHSLVDGASLEQVRRGAPSPGASYPRSFYLLDGVLLVAPAAAAPGLAMGVANSADALGWQGALALLTLLIADVAAASWFGWHAWRRIKEDGSRTVRSRAVRGWVSVGLCYMVALAALVAILVASRSSSLG